MNRNDGARMWNNGVPRSTPTRFGGALVGIAHPTDARTRRGMTLFEVLLAFAIFMGSMAALGQLIANGTRGAVQARLQTQAIVRCESKLAEVVVGAEDFETASQVPFPDDSRWNWSLSVAQTPYPNLFALTLVVSHRGANRLGDAEFTLHRLARNPQVSTTAAAEAAAATTSAGGSTP